MMQTVKRINTYMMSTANCFVKPSINDGVKTPIWNVECNAAIKLAAAYIRKGEVIALPTDTVYGLACSANNAAAIQKLYCIKERDPQKPVAICVADINHLRFWGKASHLGYDMLNLLLPGPITVVIKKSENLNNPYLNPGVLNIGIRIPRCPFIQELCKELQLPVALTSANKSKDKSSLNIYEFENLWSDISAIFDGGQLGATEEQRSASTVVDLSIPGKFKILRDGIAMENTLKVLKRFNIIMDT